MKIKIYYNSQELEDNTMLPILFTSNQNFNGEFLEDDNIKILAGDELFNVMSFLIVEYDELPDGFLFVNNIGEVEFIIRKDDKLQKFRLTNSIETPTNIDFVNNKTKYCKKEFNSIGFNNSQVYYNEFDEDDKPIKLVEIIQNIKISKSQIDIEVLFRYYRDDNSFITYNHQHIIDNSIDYHNFLSQMREDLYILTKNETLNYINELRLESENKIKYENIINKVFNDYTNLYSCKLIGFEKFVNQITSIENNDVWKNIITFISGKLITKN